MACSLGCGTEPKFLIINSFEGLLRTVIKNENLHFHERANFGSAPSRPCSERTDSLLAAFPPFEEYWEIRFLCL